MWLFAAEGADIGIVDMSDAAAVALAAEVAQAHGNTAMSAVADVSDEAAIMGAIGKIELANGPTDILVNDAGAPDSRRVTSRQVAGLFPEQDRLGFVPVFHRLHERLAAKG